MGWSAAAFVVSMVSSNVSRQQAKGARNEQKKAIRAQQEAQQRQENMQRARDAQARRQKVREERVRRAQILQRAQNMGVGGGSGMMGSVGSLGTQTGASLGFQTGQQLGAGAVSQSLQTAAGHRTSAMDFQARSDTWNSYSKTAMSAFNSMGGWDSMASGASNLFNKN